ncbi:MAG: ABC transporter ATP-binding protein [Raineya sp.]|nr:ABC transporter ATP-binding protein [Raineya sp.]MDW8295541.1 ABC transporter ATP-binding protein [Raineya sp.]
MQILEVEHLSKNYGRIQALQGVSFEVKEGEIFGLLGPNGSGKTTLLGIVTSILKANKGTFSWFGVRANTHSFKQIGTILETPNFYPHLSGYDNLALRQKIHQRGSKNDIVEVLRLVGLSERAKSPAKTYSLGMKQRLAIAAALLGNPKVLILDEPTNGLDPVGIAEIRNLILELRQRGLTIILASHLLDEVEKVCTHTAILKKGELLACGKVEEILSKGITIELASESLEKLHDFLQNRFPLVSISKENEVIKIQMSENQVDLAELNRICFEAGITLHHLAKRRKSLESVFLELTDN